MMVKEKLEKEIRAKMEKLTNNERWEEEPKIKTADGKEIKLSVGKFKNPKRVTPFSRNRI